MSDRERMYQLLDTVPDDKIAYIIGYIQGLTLDCAERPNDETLEAFAEVNEMKKNGTGEHFAGTTEELLASILEEQKC